MSSWYVFVLMFSCAPLTSACFRRSSPTSHTATTTPDPSHKIPCTSPEAAALSCLNGGQCFAVPSHDGLRETGCQCTSEWMGRRCEVVDAGVLLGVHERNVRTAHIAAGVSVAVLVLFATLVIVFVCARFKRKTWQHVGKYKCSATGMRALCDCQGVTLPDKTQHTKVIYTDKVSDSTQDKVREHLQDSEFGNRCDIPPTTQLLLNSKSDISSNNNNLTQDQNGNLHISTNSGVVAS